MLRHTVVFPEGSTVATGFSLYNWKNVIKLIPLSIHQDFSSFCLPLCLSGVLITITFYCVFFHHVALILKCNPSIFISIIYVRRLSVGFL